MPNANKATGTRFQTAVTNELLAAGLPAIQPRQTEWFDVGDIHVGDDVVMQAKAWRDMAGALRDGTAGAMEQARRAKRRFGVAVIKRPGKSAREAYVAMPLHVFIDLLHSRQSP